VEPSTGDEVLTAEGTWVPVPVPPPTYTLKPVVHRPRTTVSLPIAASSAPRLPEEIGEPIAVELASVQPITTVTPITSSLVPVTQTQTANRRRPWDADHEWADGLDLDAVLARRRAVNG
jgi:hypothetical protein